MNSDGNNGEGVGLRPSDVAELSELVRLGGLLVGHMGLYGISHAVTRELAHNVFLKLTGLLARLGNLNIEVEPDCVRVNGAPVARREPLAQAFATHLLARDIRSFSLTQGITEEQFGGLLEVLVRDEDQLQAKGGFSAAIAASAVAPKVADVRSAAGFPQLAASVPPRLRQFHVEAGETPASAGYYATGKKKFTDFVLGMFGLHTLQGGVLILMATVLSSSSNGNMVAAWSCMLTGTAAVIAIPTVCFKKGRKFIAIGYLTGIGFVLLVPLLLLGACFIALSSGHMFR